MIKYTDFFELINSDNEIPVAALFMTYGFDAELFEHHILPDFLGIIGNADENELRFRNQIALKLKEVPITVLSDGKQYNGGRTFLYDHITISKQTFHPKCYLLLYQNFLRVIIGSCNLTKSGLCFNAETVWYEDITLDKTSSLSTDLNEILSWMKGNFEIQENDAVKEILKYLNQCSAVTGFPKLLSTVNPRSVFSNLFHEIKELNEECKAISILSPFYENDRDRAIEKSLLLEFADEFKISFAKAKMKIYFPAMKKEEGNHYKVTAPVNLFEELCKKYSETELYVIAGEWEREEGGHITRALHAKIIMVELKNSKKLLLSGSINFTNNAMRSKIGRLSNIEIGVLEYGNIKFSFPPSTKVQAQELVYVQKEDNEKKIEIFIENVFLDGTTLMIQLIEGKQVESFRIEYQNHLIYETKQKSPETITINAFCLKRSQDLHIIYKDYDFYVPIQILQKDEFESEDLKLSFELDMKDIIDYLAGKYKSVSEIERLKRVQIRNGKEITQGITYFRQNLQRYYKAMAALKDDLEIPYYSEMAFKSYLSNPIGLKNLINMIIGNYKNGTSGKEETFLFLVEIENVISHLNYQEDRLEREFKDQELANIMTDVVAIRKEIYKKSKKVIKNQYDVMLNSYALEVK